ncbi:response regulator transcription factor [Aureibacillus halotolerans]|uniref:response regulator transcription factor n=1 Tax=Aureibacillus halotolerans TaxID=1508390 RepID=UPI00105F7385|nr:response regulator transcription factor [Aureibacillus halotolerans]
MKRIVVAEDQQLLRGALTALLQLEDDMCVVGETDNGIEGLEMITALTPDICVLDIEMPRMSGLEVAEQIRKNKLPTKIIIVTTFMKQGYVKKAMDTNVDGYLLKDEPIDVLVQAIRQVAKGSKYVSQDMTASLFAREENPLTSREQDVLRNVKLGYSTTDIAKQLYLSKGTVRNYLSSSMQKLGTTSRHQACLVAEEKGWMD